MIISGIYIWQAADIGVRYDKRVRHYMASEEQTKYESLFGNKLWMEIKNV